MSTENKDVETVETVEKSGYDQIKEDLRLDLVSEITSEVKKEFARSNKNFAVAKDETKPTFGEYLQEIGKLGGSFTNPDEKQKSFNWLKDKFGEKAMTQGNAAGGGNTVPTIYRNEIFDLDGFDSVFFPNGGDIFQMASNVEKYPSWDFSVTPSGDGDSAYGAGYAVAIVAENNSPTAINPVTKQITFTADKIMTLTQVSNELIRNNSVGLQQKVMAKMKRECISQIDYWVARGDGSNLVGFIGHAATKAVPRASSSHVAYADLAKMYARRLTNLSMKNYRWLINPTVLPEILTASSSNGALVWLPNGINGEVQFQIFGIQVVVTDIVPTLGNEGDVSLVYTPGMGIGVNKDITIEASGHSKFGYDLTEYRLTAAIAIKPNFTNKVKMRDGTEELAFAIVLDDATS